MDFDPASFIAPNVNWLPPYPYCYGDVLFPIEFSEVVNQIVQEPRHSPFEIALEGQSLRELIPANDSLGG
jgi:hypothetical protein